MLNLQSSIIQKRKETYLKLQNRFLTRLKKGDFDNKSGRSKHHWIEKLKKLEKQLGLVSNLKLKHWALAFALGFVTIAGNAQNKRTEKSKLHPNRTPKEIQQKKQGNSTGRTEAIAIFSELPVLGDGLLSEEQFSGDFDNDGDIDMVMFSYYGPSKLFLNDGSGDITTQREIWTPNYNAEDVLMGDLDGDGDLDFLVAEETPGNQTIFNYLINNGTGYFTTSASTALNNNRIKSLSDMDGDGDLDIVSREDIGGYIYELKIFDNDGTGTNFTSGTGLNFLPNNDELVVGQFTSDAIPDIAVINQDTVKVFINDGVGGFTEPSVINTLITGTNYNWVNIGDFGDTDGDGDDDFVVYLQEKLLHLQNDGTGSFTQSTVKENIDGSKNVYYGNVELSNLDANAALELLVDEEVYDTTTMTSSDVNKLFINNGSNVFSESAQSLAMTSGNSDVNILPMDFDGDLNNDLLLSSYTKMELFQNDGAANFSSFDDQIVDVVYSPDFELIDLDGDSDLDVIMSYTNRTLINDGSGNFTTGQELSTTLAYYYIATGDFDNDGDSDVIFTNEVIENQFNLWTNDAGTFASGNSFTAANSNDRIQAIATGDMDGDGFIDVVTVTSNDVTTIDNINIWQGNGAGSFTESSFAATNKIRGLELADVDGDSDLDVIVSAQDLSYMAVGLAVYTNTAGSLSSSGLLTPVSSPFELGESNFTANDIDDDGDVDIILVDHYPTPNEVNLLTNNGAGNFTPTIIVTANAYSHPVIADFDLDGDKDIFLGGGEYNDQLLENRGVDGFVVVGSLDSKSYGAVVGDIDGDGDEDLFTLEYYQGNRFIINNTNQASMLELDSAQLVTFYDETGGGSWTNSTNWKTGDVSTWFGVTVVADRVTAIDLNTNNLTGAFTVNSGLDSLTTLDLSGNLLTGIPDLSGTNITTLDVSDNQLEFGSLESNAGIAGINYLNQADIGTADFVLVKVDSIHTLTITTSGTANLYQWFKDASSITGANSSSHNVGPFAIADNGDYHCEVTNTIATGLTISSAITTLQQESLLELDSVQLVQLYNETGGADWTDNTNWLSGDVNTWFGVTVTNDRVSSIILGNNNLAGAITVNTDLDELLTLDVSGNAITAIPDWTGTNMTTIDVSDNNLEFGSLEPNAAIPGIIYTNQGLIGTALSENLEARTEYQMSITTSGVENMYQWYQGGVAIAGATGATHTLPSVRTVDVGEYYCEVTNGIVTGLTLTTQITTINANASISGTILVNETTPLSDGEIMLLRVTNTDGYDSTSIISLGADGTYIHTSAPLGDYITLAKPDTITFSNSLPTYWGEITNTIYWEEADTIRLDSTIVDLNIVLESIPTEIPVGEGLISGFLEEEVPDGGRIEGKRNVSGAGVSVRRGKKHGRLEEHELELVAYIYTDDEGKFRFENLEEDEYKLNIQYPGYPMDPNSFIDIPIGTGFDSEVVIEALAADGKIVVTEIEITGIYQNDSFNDLRIYPNPTNERLFLDAMQYQTNEFKLVLLSIEGVKIQTTFKDVKEMKNEGIDISMLEKGIYILEVFDLNKQLIKTVRVVIKDK